MDTMDIFSLDPGCYQVDAYTDNASNGHQHDTMQIDSNNEIHVLGHEKDVTGNLIQDMNGNYYLHFEDPNDSSKQLNLYYYEKSSNDISLFFGTDEEGNLFCLKMKKGECKA